MHVHGANVERDVCMVCFDKIFSITGMPKRRLCYCHRCNGIPRSLRTVHRHNAERREKLRRLVAAARSAVAPHDDDNMIDAGSAPESKSPPESDSSNKRGSSSSGSDSNRRSDSSDSRDSSDNSDSSDSSGDPGLNTIFPNSDVVHGIIIYCNRQ